MQNPKALPETGADHAGGIQWHRHGRWFRPLARVSVIRAISDGTPSRMAPPPNSRRRCSCTVAYHGAGTNRTGKAEPGSSAGRTARSDPRGCGLTVGGRSRPRPRFAGGGPAGIFTSAPAPSPKAAAGQEVFALRSGTPPTRTDARPRATRRWSFCRTVICAMQKPSKPRSPTWRSVR